MIFECLKCIRHYSKLFFFISSLKFYNLRKWVYYYYSYFGDEKMKT